MSNVTAAPVLYEVTIHVANEAAQSWAAYMRDVHVTDVYATGCFVSAWVARLPELDLPGKSCFRASYVAPDQQTLQVYQKSFAPALQRDHSEKFGALMQVSRITAELVVTMGANHRAAKGG